MACQPHVKNEKSALLFLSNKKIKNKLAKLTLFPEMFHVTNNLFSIKWSNIIIFINMFGHFVFIFQIYVYLYSVALTFLSETTVHIWACMV